MNKPDLISSYEFRGHVAVEWFDVTEKSEIPALPWQQVYALGNLDGNVPIIYFSQIKDDYNLPGGQTDLGESIEQTVVREVQEETNLIVASWQPLGYQRCIRPETGEVSYQFRVYAELRKDAEFTNDPGGGVLGYDLVELDEVNKYINYGKVGERLVSLSRKYFENTI